MKKMKKIIAAAMLLAMPCAGWAQSEWEIPNQNRQDDTEVKKKTLFCRSEPRNDEKYLAGAVPMVNGKVVFTFDEDVPGKSAQEIYDIVYATVERLTQAENQFKESQISLVNKAEHVIAAKFQEWLVFKKSAFVLDQTVFKFMLIANCSDGHLNMTISRLSYAYELEREGGGLIVSADEWITDEQALNKAKTKLNRYSGKFRRKTIDRMEEIAQTIRTALNAPKP